MSRSKRLVTMEALKNRLQHYAELPDNVWDEFCSLQLDTVRFSKGEDLIREGDPTPHVLVIAEGWAIRHRSLDDGRRQVCNVMMPGDLFDLQALGDLKADHTVTAATDITAHILSSEEFLKAIGQSPQLAALFWWVSVQEESILREQIVRIGRYSARERIGHFLLELQRRVGMAFADEQEVFELPLTRVDLADALGLTPVHVSRTMSALRRAGLIDEKNDLICITDRPALVRMAQFEGDYLHIKRLSWGGDNIS